MATTEQIDNFITVISNYARIEFSTRKKWVLPSVCTAQACLESGYNLNAKTIFGIKGKDINLTTHEYINGKYIIVNDSFKKYDNVQDSVKGYYDLITKNSRYKKAVNNFDYMLTIKYIFEGGYATDPLYYKKIVSIIKKYNLIKYDYFLPTNDLINDIIKGKYGNGEERKIKLNNLNYNYAECQQLVNERLKK